MVHVEHLNFVAELAMKERSADLEARRKWYAQLGLTDDETLK